MRVRWENLEPQGYEDMVSVLLSRLYPDAQRIDGKGGDGGRDVKIVSPLDGHVIDEFELKSFTGRMNSSRRRQVEHSLNTVAASEPPRWTLVVPIDPTPSELKWFDELRPACPFPIRWYGITWLDEKMSEFPDIHRYFIDGAEAEVLRLLLELNKEEAIVPDAPSAARRLQRLSVRLNEIDPFYRYEMATGPEAAEYRPPNVVLSVGFEDVRVDVYPKFLGAVQQRPVSFSVTVAVEPDDLVLQNALDFGLEATIPSHRVSSVTVDAPADLGGTFTGAELTIFSAYEKLEEPIILSMNIWDGDELIASCPARLLERTGGSKGSIFTGTDSTGWLGVRMTLNTVDNEFNVEFTLTYRPAMPTALVPLFRWTDAWQPSRRLSILWPEGSEMSEEMSGPFPVDDSLGRVIKALAFLQEKSGKFYELPPSLNNEKAQDFVVAAALLQGESIELKWESFTLNLDQWSPKLENLLEGLPQAFIFDEESWFDFEGVKIPMGKVRTYCQSAYLANTECVRKALEAGAKPRLQLVPGNSDIAQQVIVPELRQSSRY